MPRITNPVSSIMSAALKFPKSRPKNVFKKVLKGSSKTGKHPEERLDVK